MMNAVVLAGPNDFSPQQYPIPQLEDGDILLQMRKAALCGTDIRILEGKKTKDVRYPSIIGHEICGVVHAMGKDVTGFSIGDKLAVANVISCHACSSCLAGRENACLNRKAVGYEFDGGFAEYIRIPALAIGNGNVVKLPEHVSFEEGALIEPLACCIRGLKNAGTGFNDIVLVVGAGPIGLMHLELSKIVGASKVIVSEPIASRREKAVKLGADVVVDPVNEDLAAIVNRETCGLGADVVIFAIGAPSIVNSTIKLCRKGGVVNLFAGFAGTGECSIEANVIHYGEITVNGSTAYKLNDYLEAAQMVVNRRVNLKELVTHTFSIADFQKAYEVCKSGAGLKVLIEP